MTASILTRLGRGFLLACATPCVVLDIIETAIADRRHEIELQRRCERLDAQRTELIELLADREGTLKWTRQRIVELTDQLAASEARVSKAVAECDKWTGVVNETRDLLCLRHGQSSTEAIRALQSHATSVAVIDRGVVALRADVEAALSELHETRDQLAAAKAQCRQHELESAAGRTAMAADERTMRHLRGQLAAVEAWAEAAEAAQIKTERVRAAAVESLWAATATPPPTGPIEPGDRFWRASGSDVGRVFVAAKKTAGVEGDVAWKDVDSMGELERRLLDPTLWTRLPRETTCPGEGGGACDDACPTHETIASPTVEPKLCARCLGEPEPMRWIDDSFGAKLYLCKGCGENEAFTADDIRARVAARAASCPSRRVADPLAIACGECLADVGVKCDENARLIVGRHDALLGSTLT